MSECRHVMCFVCVMWQCISANLSLWREASDSARISLPHLVDVDWTIIVKKASSEVQHMSVPALLVQLDIEQTPHCVDEPPRVEKVLTHSLTHSHHCCGVLIGTVHPLTFLCICVGWL